MVDLGGEGRHPRAWNLNPRTTKTFGPQAGQPIPRLIVARGEALPLRDASVDVLIAERTPLRMATLREIERVAKPSATIILRHVEGPLGDPHRVALAMLKGRTHRGTSTIGSHTVCESIIELGREL